MKYVGNDDEAKIGDRVVTSGQDRIFPKDLPVGIITQVKPGSQYKQIRVRPSASIGKLEEVIVLLTTDPLQFKHDAPATTTPAAAPVAAPSASVLPNSKPVEKQP